MKKNEKTKDKKYTSIELFKSGFIAGFGWSFGVTVGFVIVSTVIVIVLRSLGGLPVIGGFIANIVQETQTQLIRRNVISR